ncbi:MAG: SPOR domain-containing protein [Bacteroidetes bacterium]|nr:SPOR domain-containing protein [Bacteroidota bacterium]
MNIHQTILKGVKEQLFFNDYLVLPGFGGFVLKKSPAHFSSAGTVILPPGKTVSFNAQLKQNDGVFVQWLQSQLTCDASQALSHLTDFAEYCRSVLNNRGRLTVDGIGFFYHDFENNICFEPQHQTNFLRDSFGLSPVFIKELEVEMSVKPTTVFADRIIERAENTGHSEIKKQRNYRKVAIAAVSGAFLLSALFIVVSTSKINGPLKSAFFGKENTSVYSPVNYSDLNLKDLSTDKKDYVADANGIASLELDNNKTIAVKALEVEIPESIHVHAGNHKIISFHKKFEVVLGCFSILNNAHKMVSKLTHQQIKAAVSGQNEKGLYIVSGGGFNSKQEAIEQLSVLKGTCPSAWIKTAE